MNKCLICSDSGQIRNGTSDISSMVGENFVSFCEIVNHCQLLYTVSLRVNVCEGCNDDCIQETRAMI